MSIDSSDSLDDIVSGEKAIALMQPAFIRVIDHLRAMLEKSDWKGQYETVHQWPQGTPPELQAEVLWLKDQLENVDEDQQDLIEDQLADLPQPVPVYLLHLTKAEQTKTLNLWELCYQICLEDYTPQLERTTFAELPLDRVHGDRTLWDEDDEVDWTQLDEKTAYVVNSAFESFQ